MVCRLLDKDSGPVLLSAKFSWTWRKRSSPPWGLLANRLTTPKRKPSMWYEILPAALSISAQEVCIVPVYTVAACHGFTYSSITEMVKANGFVVCLTDILVTRTHFEDLHSTCSKEATGLVPGIFASHRFDRLVGLFRRWRPSFSLPLVLFYFHSLQFLTLPYHTKIKSNYGEIFPFSGGLCTLHWCLIYLARE
jgi:hypothetical protein